MKNLQMPLIKKWFDMTKLGIKREDYREITPYWERRFYKCTIGCTKSKIYGNCQEFIGNEVVNSFPCHKCEYSEPKKFDVNTMTLGYPKSTDKNKIIRLQHKGIEIKTGNHELGAEPNKLYFVIKHGYILTNCFDV